MVDYDKDTWPFDRGAVMVRLDKLEEGQKDHGKKLDGIQTSVNAIQKEISAFQASIKTLIAVAAAVGSILGFLINAAMKFIGG